MATCRGCLPLPANPTADLSKNDQNLGLIAKRRRQETPSHHSGAQVLQRSAPATIPAIKPNVISQHRAPISKSALSFIFIGGSWRMVLFAWNASVVNIVPCTKIVTDTYGFALHPNTRRPKESSCPPSHKMMRATAASRSAQRKNPAVASGLHLPPVMLLRYH